MRCVVCTFLVTILLAGPSAATSPTAPKLSKEMKARCRALAARHDGQDRSRAEKLVRLYEPMAGQYQNGAGVFFAALATHSPLDLAEVALADGQGRFRMLDSCSPGRGCPDDLTLRLLAVADPTIYGPPLVEYLVARFHELSQEPHRLTHEWEPYVVALGQRDQAAAVNTLLAVAQVDAELNSHAQTSVIRALGKVADRDPEGIVQRRFRRLLEQADADSWHLHVCLRALGSCSGTKGLRILVDSLDRAPLADCALRLLARNVSLTDDEQRKHFGSLPPEAVRDRAQRSQGWKAWWHERAPDTFWHPTNNMWTTRPGDFWHVNSGAPPPWQPPLAIYLATILGLLAVGWLLPVPGLRRLGSGRRLRPTSSHRWVHELAQFVIFLGLLALAAGILRIPARLLLGDYWGRIGMSIVMLLSGSILGTFAATRLDYRGIRDDGCLSDTRVPVTWLIGICLLTMGTVLLFRQDDEPRAWCVGAGVFGLANLAFALLRRTATRPPHVAKSLQFSLRQLMGAVTACAMVLWFVSMSPNLGMISVWLPLGAWVYLAFRAAEAAPDEPEQFEMPVAGKSSDRLIRTGATAMVLSILLMLLSVLPSLLGALAAGISGAPQLSLGILAGGPIIGISLGGLTGLFCGSTLGRGFAWVFTTLIGWSCGMGVLVVGAEDNSAFCAFVALTFVAVGQIVGICLARRVRGFAARGRRRAGRAAGLSIAVGAVAASIHLLAIGRTENEVTEFMVRAFGLVWLTATFLGALAALSGAQWRRLGTA